MKKIVFILVFLTVFSAASAFVEVNAQDTVHMQDLQQTISVEINTNESKIDFSAILPVDVSVLSWNIDGVSQEKYQSSTEQMDYLNVQSNVYLWSFSELEESTITLQLVVETEKAAQMHYVWLYPPNNFGTKQTNIFPKTDLPFVPTTTEETDMWFNLAIMLSLLLVLIIVFYSLKIQMQKNKRFKKYEFV